MTAAPVEREEYVLTDDGARLWTATRGRGRPFVWCHGGPGGTDDLAPLAAMLDDAALVHRYEQRACGRSSGGPPHTMARSIADLEALRRHWGHERWLVGGLSFGAALALACAAEHRGHVAGIAFVSCLVRLADQPDWFEQYRRTQLARIPEPARARYLELRRRRLEGGDADPALAAERRLSSRAPRRRTGICPLDQPPTGSGAAPSTLQCGRDRCRSPCPAHRLPRNRLNELPGGADPRGCGPGGVPHSLLRERRLP